MISKLFSNIQQSQKYLSRELSYSIQPKLLRVCFGICSTIFACNCLYTLMIFELLSLEPNCVVISRILKRVIHYMNIRLLVCSGIINIVNTAYPCRNKSAFTSLFLYIKKAVCLNSSTWFGIRLKAPKAKTSFSGVINDLPQC